jgi:hypothetical protein
VVVRSAYEYAQRDGDRRVDEHDGVQIDIKDRL